MPRLDTTPASIIPPKVNPAIKDSIVNEGVWIADRVWAVWLAPAALTDFALEETQHTREAADLDAATEYLLRPRKTR